MKRPNILFMHSHNTGRYIQPYGHAVPTPHLQRLASEGVLFRKAFAAAPTCSPSRAAFLTGQCPHAAGMLGLAHRGFAMPDYRRHIVATLKAAGYHTAHSGVEHTAPDIRQIGYDELLSLNDTNYPAHQTQPDPASAAVDFLHRVGPQPFFLNLGLNETHRPFPDPDPTRHPAEDPRYCLPVRPFPDTPETRAESAAFKAAARVMDASYGRVLAALDETGLAQNTVVFCFTDHGLQFPHHICNLTDHGLGVYLIVRGPGGFEGGRVCDALVSLLDLFPTVCALIGIAPPPWLEGKSLLPLVRGEMERLHDELFGEVNYHAAYEPMRSVRTERWKYIRRYDGRQRRVLPNVDDTPSKTFLLSQGWLEQALDQEMLYDLIFDPDETCNLANRPEMARILADLRARLDRWMHATNDPLLQGPVPAPRGARINDPDGSSPRETPRIVA